MADRRTNLLALMADRQWHDKGQMIAAAGHRFATVIHELRQEGYVIETDPVRSGEFRYCLHATPAEDVRTIVIRGDGQAVMGLETVE